MSEELRWNLSVQVVRGPTMTDSGALVVDAYNKSQVVIPAADGADESLDVTVDTTNADMLVVKASQYVYATDAANVLQFAINPDAADPADVGPSGNLTAPLMLMGANVVRLLVVGPSDLIRFTNPIPAAITVDIIVGGDVTP